jgi:hypothetical protein
MSPERIAAVKAWLLDNAVWLVPLALGVLANIANGVRKHYAERRGLVRFLDFLVDVLSVTARKDSPNQSLKLPLVPSKRPQSIALVPPRQDDRP